MFDFSSTAYSLNLGSAASSLTAGTMELRTANGLLGSGAANTSLAIGASAELLYSTRSATRSLNSLTLNNSGSVRATSGVLTANSVAFNNLFGGLVHGDGAKIQFASNVTLANAGTLRATGANGAIRFYNPVKTANLGTVDLVSGGRAYLANVLTNTGATLTTAGTGAAYELLNGKIIGGSVAAGALKFTPSGGTLDGVSLLGPTVSVPASASVTFENGSTFASGLTLNANTLLSWNQSGTLSGKTLTFTGSNPRIYLNAANASLILASATTGTRASIFSPTPSAPTLRSRITAY
ncbi:MAG: hypothetical protein EXS43_09405 [Opitutus sp.]|nr:hypothetical protein [Opitutus sp.]